MAKNNENSAENCKKDEVISWAAQNEYKFKISHMKENKNQS